MDIREDIDELRNGIVWRNALQQFAFSYPPLYNLVVCHLDPYRVDAIRRHRLNGSDHNTFSTFHIHRIEGIVGQSIGNLLLVGRNHEVIVLRVVMSGRERYGIQLMLGQIPCIGRLLTMIVASGQQTYHQ